MIPQFSLTTSGLLDPRVFDAWSHAQRARVRRGVAVGMKEGGTRMASTVNAQVQRNFKTKKRAFANQFRAKVYDQKPDRLPMLLVRSRVPWMGIYDRGGTIQGPVLIPLIKMGTKAFKRVVDTILRTGAGFFKKVNGKTLLFAEYQPEYGRPLARFRRAERTRLGGAKVQKGQDIPIAVLVPRVEVKKRIDLQGAVRTGLPALARLIQQRILNG